MKQDNKTQNEIENYELNRKYYYI